ncbi:MAG: Fic family protein [Desulfomonile sp.]
MQPTDFSDENVGRLVQISEGCWAFVPNSLPPRLPATWELTNTLSKADRGLAELNGVARNLPNPNLLIGPFLRNEAVLSTRIEGTQASLSDLFFFEASKRPQSKLTNSPPDVIEVFNYVQASTYAFLRLKEFPLSLRLIREVHAKLMEGVRGENQTPGEFRRFQNWIGPDGCNLMDSTYVPPPVPEMLMTLSEMEKFIHADSDLPPLIRLAMLHYQFEAIHPFGDGNGRVGRLLISLLLLHEGLLTRPLLYLSAYFERNRREYYVRLLEVSTQGRWLEWIIFFLKGIVQQSLDAIRRTEVLLDLREQYRNSVQSARSSALLLTLIDSLFEHPVLTIPNASSILGITYRAAEANIEKLFGLGILQRFVSKKRPRVFLARGIIDAMLDFNPWEK